MVAEKIEGDDELKRQQRRRLIGSVALFTVLIVVVPMVLEREPKVSVQDIELHIPDRDKAGEFSSQMVIPEAVSEPAAASAAVAASAPVVVSTPAPVTVAPTKAAPALEPAKKPAPTLAPAVKHDPVKPHTAPPTAPAHAKPEPKKPAPAVKANFALQVGAFAHADAARDLQKKLQAHGFHAYTEKAGENTRVRVGGYATRADAEKGLTKLKAKGFQPVVVSLN